MRIAVLGSYSIQFLVEKLKKVNPNFNVFEGNYLQIEQYFFGDDNSLFDFSPDFIIIHDTTLSFKQKFYNHKKGKFFKTQIDRLKSIIERIIFENPNTKIVYPNLDHDNEMNFGHYYFKMPNSIDLQLNNFNYQLSKLALKYENLFIFDINNLIFRFGKVRDRRLVISSDLHFTLSFTEKLAFSINKLIKTLNGQFIKCIITDLDNTLWGGSIGEDGIEGIKLGNFGVGKAFTDFQRWLKALKDRGIILCVCSKNQAKLAKEPFLNHPDTVLKLKDIAVFISNWKNKADNIRHIKNILNIGYESIVFLDDNPFERNLVKTNIEKIIVPEMPEDPSLFKSFLIDQDLFEMSSFSNQDTKRTEYFQRESLKRRRGKSFYNIDSHLQSLNMVATVEGISEKNISRLAQLVQRTNQFNARTIRHSETFIQNILNDPNYYSFCFGLFDNFGSHGIVAFVILHKQREDSVFINTFLMSCRVFERGLEYFAMDFIKSFLTKNKIKYITAEWVPTQKNELIEKFYLNIGFKKFKSMQSKIKIEELKAKPFFIKLKGGTYLG